MYLDFLSLRADARFPSVLSRVPLSPSTPPSPVCRSLWSEQRTDGWREGGRKMDQRAEEQVDRPLSSAYIKQTVWDLNHFRRMEEEESVRLRRRQ